MDSNDVDADLCTIVREAAARGSALCLRGSGSKDFYGGLAAGQPLDLLGHRGIIDYEAAELVLIARAGTPLSELDQLLSEKGQMLAFEPPRFGGGGTLGGCVAAGLSGPRRPYSGSVRDYVLGVRLIDGRGESLRFGGRVIKNVAGYDVARLNVGAMGTLGILRDIALKVVPRPRAERSLSFEFNEASAIDRVNRWAGRFQTLSACAHARGRLTLRLSGADAAIRSTARTIGGEEIDDADAFWESLRDQTHEFFRQPGPLWRISLPATTPPLGLPLPQLLEWGGALRWVAGDIDYATLRRQVAGLGGHVTAFRAAPADVPVFQPLPEAIRRLHGRIRQVFDPQGIFNRGRFYDESAGVKAA